MKWLSSFHSKKGRPLGRLCGETTETNEHSAIRVAIWCREVEISAHAMHLGIVKVTLRDELRERRPDDHFLVNVGERLAVETIRRCREADMPGALEMRIDSAVVRGADVVAFIGDYEIEIAYAVEPIGEGLDRRNLDHLFELLGVSGLYYAGVDSE